MSQQFMNLKILLPFGIFASKGGVKRLVVETPAGSFGFLPRRLDCVTTLVPGILVYETEKAGETFTAVDEGVLLKTGFDILISVRRAVEGSDLARLRETVTREYLTLDDNEKNVRSVMAKLETGFLHRFAAFQHG